MARRIERNKPSGLPGVWRNDGNVGRKIASKKRGGTWTLVRALFSQFAVRCQSPPTLCRVLFILFFIFTHLRFLVSRTITLMLSPFSSFRTGSSVGRASSGNSKPKQMQMSLNRVSKRNKCFAACSGRVKFSTSQLSSSRRLE